MPDTLDQITLRPIKQQDNSAMAAVIRTTLTEFDAAKPGTVYYDESTDHLFELFQNKPRSIYHVAEWNGEIIGGGGIYPSPGLPDDTCELVKMYILRKVRGIGLGRLLIQKSIDFAAAAGYANIYLETMPELKQALNTYTKFGFEYLDGPMGDTGHFGCELWMKKKL